MNAAQLILMAVSALAVLGLIGIVTGAMSRRPKVRRTAAGFGGVALAAAGLLFMLSGVIGLSNPDDVMYGFLLLVFGTGVSVAPTFGRPAKDPADLAR